MAGCSEQSTLNTETATEETPTTSSVTGSPITSNRPASLLPGETYETENDWSVAIETVGVYVSINKFGTVHPDPYYADDAQFVVADAVVSGSNAPDPANLNLFVQTDSLDRSGVTYVAAESNQDDVRQRFGFTVPVSPAPNEGAIVWSRDSERSVRWTLPADVLTAIVEPAEFELHAFDAVDVSGEEVEVLLKVENVGKSDGRFLAEAGNAALSDQPEIAIEVPRGETVATTRQVNARFRDEDEMTVVLRWRDTVLERTIQRK